ncbi:MAG TPA: tail fiber protein [Patescibacteria group bacterium]|nr:tail fiber protein [Patescibacteria group bacterium]
MYRIDDPSAAATLPVPEAALTEGFWTEGNPAAGTPATLERASWFNMVQEELVSIVTAGGITRSKVVYNQVLLALKKLFQAAASINSKTTLASYTYAVTDLNALVRRSNGGAAMTDILPGSTAGVMPVGWVTTSVNNDATASITITVGAGGGQIDGGASVVVPPGKSVTISSDGTNYWSGGIATLGATPPGEVAHFAGTTAPAGWLTANGALVSRTTYAALFAAIAPSLGACTISIAAPAVVTFASHGLVAGSPVSFETTGALPTGLTVGTTYYVLAAGLTANSFEVSTTVGGAAVVTTGAQSGVQTLRPVPFGPGDGATTFGLPDLRGVFVRGVDAGRGLDADRAGVFGSYEADQFASHSHDAGWVQTAASSTTAWSWYGGNTGRYTGTAGGTETRGKNVALLTCIKY